MRRNSATTLHDVAQEVGVSTTTVSIVMHGTHSTTRVSEATRARILEVANRMRYRPNGVARGLHRRRMDTLGVVAVIDGGELNLYFLEVLNGILEASAHHGQNTTVFSIVDWHADQAKVLKFCDGRVDGVILLAPLHLSGDCVRTLLHHTPFVTIHGNETLPEVPNLDVDNEGGAYAMTRYLIGLGHRQIAHFAGETALYGARERLAGYRRALEEAGIPFEEARVVMGNFSHYSGREQTKRLIQQTPAEEFPTAIFCANDAIAVACMETLAEAGIQVPSDISVVGFDDTLNARTSVPPLTTVRQPLRRMGARAVELLLIQVCLVQEKEPLAVVQGSLLEAQESEPGECSARPAARQDIPEEMVEATESSRHPTEIFEVELVLRGSAGPPRSVVVLLDEKYGRKEAR